MQYDAAFHLNLHYLQDYTLRGGVNGWSIFVLTFMPFKHSYCASGSVDMITFVFGGNFAGSQLISLPS